MPNRARKIQNTGNTRMRKLRPEIKALKLFQLNKPVAKEKINKYVGTGDYASKYVSFLNTRYGYKIVPEKKGRIVKKYTMVKEPKNSEAIRSGNIVVLGPRKSE